MTKKIVSVILMAVMLCVSICGCGGVFTSVDTDDIASRNSKELMEKLAAAINNQDIDSFDQLTTDNMRNSDSDIYKYFDMITKFVVSEVSFESNKQDGASYEIPIHYYVTFSDEYTGNQYKTGINNMTDGFTIVKIGDNYKLDAITRYGTN